MTDSRRDESDPTQQLPYEYPGYTDPAYANQTSYGPYYQAPPAPDQTQQLPPYSPYAYQPPTTEQFGAQYPPGGAPPQPPEPPESDGSTSRLWLWALAALSVVVVIGLVIALVIVNTSQQQTVVAPPAAPPEPSFTTAPPTTTRTPSTPRLPLPIPIPGTTTAPGDSATPGATETVVYDVTGTGRAINITYIDSGGMFQTEFNVMLPWSKQVELSAPADQSASISIINVGREISCSISVNGVPLRQRSGSGLTICSPVS